MEVEHETQAAPFAPDPAGPGAGAGRAGRAGAPGCPGVCRGLDSALRHPVSQSGKDAGGSLGVLLPDGGGGRSGGRPAHGPGRRPYPPVLPVHHRAGGGPGPAGGQPVSGGAGAGLSAPRRPGGGPLFLSGGHPAGDCPHQSHPGSGRGQYAADPLFCPGPRVGVPDHRREGRALAAGLRQSGGGHVRPHRADHGTGAGGCVRPDRPGGGRGGAQSALLPPGGGRPGLRGLSGAASVGLRRSRGRPGKAQPPAFLPGGPARRGLRLLVGQLRRGPSLLAGGRRAPGRPRRGALLRAPPGCHPQHGRHRHLPGGVRPVHLQCLRYPPGAPPAAHHHPHLHPGLRRNRRSTRRRGRHAGHGAPVRGPAGGGGGIGPGHRPGAGHGAHRRQRSGRPRLRRCSVRRRTPG